MFDFDPTTYGLKVDVDFDFKGKMMCIVLVKQLLHKLKSLVLSVRHKSVLDRIHSTFFQLPEMQV
jgi:hypothetical protein